MENVMLGQLGKGRTRTERAEAVRYFRHALAKTQKGDAIEDPTTIAWPSYITRLVPLLTDCLEMSPVNSPEVQLDATWALTNILCGDEAQTHEVVFASRAPRCLLRLAREAAYLEIRDQAVWALANIAGDCEPCRRLLCRLGFLPLLADLIHQHAAALDTPETKISSLTTAIWALSNVCRGQPPLPHLMEIASILPQLRAIIEEPGDGVEAEVDAVWSLAYLADGEDMAMMTVVNSGTLVPLLDKLREGNGSIGVIRGALRMVGNLLTGSDMVTQAVLEAGAVEALYQLLEREGAKGGDESILREVLWSLSNVAAGTVEQVEAFLGRDELVEKVVRLAKMGLEPRVQREAAWALNNAATGGSPAQVRQLVSRGCLSALRRCLDEQREGRCLRAMVAAVRAILETPGTSHGLRLRRLLIDDAGITASIRRLRRHPNRPLRLAAHHLFTNHLKTPLPPRPPSKLPSIIYTKNAPF